MRVLHITPYYAPAFAFGGVVRSVEGLARAQARRGHQILILTTDALDLNHRIDAPQEQVLDGVRVVRCANLLPAFRRRFNLSTPHHLRMMAERLLAQADVIHCHEFRTIENLVVTPLAARRGLPLVLSPHGTLTLKTGRSSLKALWDRVLSSAVALRFDDVIALSGAELRDVEMIWPRFGHKRRPTRFHVAPNGVDPEQFAEPVDGGDFRARYGLGDGPLCLFMGRLHARKGIDVLLAAFRKADVPGARLVIAGPDEGMLERLQPQLDARVVVTGYLEGTERLAALATADVLALPAVGEGLPMVVLEAMATGRPVIISPGCNLPEVAEAGAGLEVEPTVEAVAQALRLLLSDPTLRLKMGTAGQQLIRERFTWDAVSEQVEGIYRQAIGRSRSAD